MYSLADLWSMRALAQHSAAELVLGARARLPSAWHGSAGSAALDRSLAAHGLPMQEIARALEQAARVVCDYAADLAAAQQQAAAAVTAADLAHARVLRAREVLMGVPARLSGIGLTGAVAVMTDAELARIDIGAALADLAAVHMRSDQVAGQVRSAAHRTAAVITGSTEVLSGWETGTSFGPYGAPAETDLVGSGAHQRWADSLARSRPPVVPADPFSARVWWQGLDPRLREDYLQLYPSTVGGGAGLPAADRDRANRRALAMMLTDARARTAAAGRPLPPVGTEPVSAADRISASLRAAGYADADALAVAGALAVEHQLAATDFSGHNGTNPDHPKGQGPPVQLLLFQPTAFDGRGRAAIAVGDVATAGTVAVLVPGMTAKVSSYLGEQVEDARRLQSAAAAQAGPGGAAVVALMGYRAPDLETGVASRALADAGARTVATDVAALRAMRTTDTARTTVVAHSYGSTTAAIAFYQYGARADALVLIGSPGAGSARTASDLHLPDGQVFVGSASSDPVTTVVQQLQDPDQQLGAVGAAGRHFGGFIGGGLVLAIGGLGLGATRIAMRASGGLGVDPAGERFGAIRFHAETGDPDRYRLANHSAYLERGSESLQSISAVVAGHPERVSRAPARPEAGAHFQGIDPETAHRPVR